MKAYLNSPMRNIADVYIFKFMNTTELTKTARLMLSD